MADEKWSPPLGLKSCLDYTSIYHLLLYLFRLHSKRKKDSESGVVRGIDFQFVSNVINFDFPKVINFISLVLYSFLFSSFFNVIAMP